MGDASRPVDAVIFGGIRHERGINTAMVALYPGYDGHFELQFIVRYDRPWDTSLPVPAVVGIAKKGFSFFSKEALSCRLAGWHGLEGAGFVTLRIHSLCSINELPPPTPQRRPVLLSRDCAALFNGPPWEDRGGRRHKRTTSMPAASRPATIGPTSPAASTPLS